MSVLNANTAQSRHANYYFQVMEMIEEMYLQGMKGNNTSLAIFDQEKLQIDAAWNWVIKHSPSQATDNLLIKYGKITSNIIDMRYHMERENLNRINLCLGAARRCYDLETECKLLNNLANTLYALGRINDAIEIHVRRVDLAEKLGDMQGKASSLGNLGLALASIGDLSKAIEHYKEAISLKRALNDRLGEAQTLCNLGTAHRRLGNLSLGMLYYHQQLAIAQGHRI